MVMDRDEATPEKGFSAQSYIEALDHGLVPIYETGTIFQQENVSIHRAEVTQIWTETHGIHVMDWPAHSPDLNPL